MAKVLAQSREVVAGTRAMQRMNHEDGGFDCPGCAWPDDRKGLHLDICENGIKHVTWEMTRKRVDREFFASHTVSELSGWTDFALEDQGRLTEPMAYDVESDKYVPISWSEAFDVVGATLRGLDSPHQASFYTSGRLSNEATFLYQLWVREFGTNNLPDCSNMCHEASGRAMTASLGTGKGTCDLDDWEQGRPADRDGGQRRIQRAADADVARRGASPWRADRAHQPTDRGRPAAAPSCRTSSWRWVPSTPPRPAPWTFSPASVATWPCFAASPRSYSSARRPIPRRSIGSSFSATRPDSTAYRSLVEATGWAEIVRQSGVEETAIRQLAEVYLGADRTVVSWCLGLTQQEHGVDTVREIVNLLLLRGNIGREGAGPSPVRGHSNVQGNRTCGIDHRPPGSCWTA